MTLVTIITPSLNQAAYLEQTLLSVIEQDYPEIEYLVVDGGSSDGSVALIKKYSSRIAWWTSEPDLGQAHAINKGLARARGDLVAWINSDDYYLPGAVSAAVKLFGAHPEAGMIYGDMLAVDQHGRPLNFLKYRQLSVEDLLCFQIIGQPAVFMRRATLGEAGGLDSSFHLLLDHHLWLRMALHGKFLHMPQMWAAARFHAAAKNRAQAHAFGREAFRILEWAGHEPGLAPILTNVGRRARASAHRVDARYLLDARQPWPALKAWTRALLIHPSTALARMNIFASALLSLAGLGALRSGWLRKRQAGYVQKWKSE